MGNRKIDFAIIGAERAGTTSLYKYLQQHCSICMSEVKEPGYFAYNRDWNSGLDDYHRLYSPTCGQLCGEASTMYTWFPDYPQTSRSLFGYNPDLKLIYLIRNPVSRMISQLTMWIAWGVIKNDTTQLIHNPVFVNRSRYWLQLRQYLQYFSTKQIYIVISEELFANPNPELDRLYKFLDVQEHNSIVENVWENPSVGQIQELWSLKEFKRLYLVKKLTPFFPPGLRAMLRKPFERTMIEKPILTPEMLNILWNLVENDVFEMEKFIGKSLSYWYPK